MKINYNDKHFRGVLNAANGQVSGQTLFHYRQEGDLLWGTYKGGSIRMGTLTGLVREDGRLTFHYQHVDSANNIRIGHCNSQPEYLPDGRLRLRESWSWLNGDRSSGTSIVEEDR